MKKGMMLFGLFFSLLFVQFVIAANETDTNPLDEQSKVDRAYSCLDTKLGSDCSTSLQDNIFSLLALGKCKPEVLSNSDDNECWPKSDCNIKTTAQAVLALDAVGSSTVEAEQWLISKNETPEEMIWYLEIESPKQTLCSITYGGSTFVINVKEDKKLSSSAGTCLSLSSGDWWLTVSPSCYEKTFEISCDEQFLTTLLFKKKTSSTIQVSESVSSASAEGTTTEKVNFKCFSTTGKCDYEGTLWAALALDHLGYDKTPYMPYLISMSDENKALIPESFLYLLTGSSDFRTNLLLLQKEKFWDESGDKFYDTALALYPFQYEDPAEKNSAKEWFLEVQGKDGCWDNGNIRNNAFILYSVWPKSTETNVDFDCEDSNYFCMSNTECAGEILDQYSCAGVFKCCDTAPEIKDCTIQGGQICTSDQLCVGGTTAEASGVDFGESCCVGGRCELKEEDAGLSCEFYSGKCRAYACESGEQQSFSYECTYGDLCCMPGEAKSYWWIWLLVILIILAVLAIIFRDKFRTYYDRVVKGKTKPKPYTPSVGMPMMRRPMPPRRIIPPNQRPVTPRPLPKKSNPEIDDVLKKLKDMSN